MHTYLYIMCIQYFRSAQLRQTVFRLTDLFMDAHNTLAALNRYRLLSFLFDGYLFLSPTDRLLRSDIYSGRKKKRLMCGAHRYTYTYTYIQNRRTYVRIYMYRHTYIYMYIFDRRISTLSPRFRTPIVSNCSIVDYTHFRSYPLSYGPL